MDNTSNKTLLSELSENQRAVIEKCCAGGVLQQKLLDMGFISGAEVLMVRNAPLRDPIEIEIQNFFLSVRRSEAARIKVTPV
ncbi:MAG: ferrous iron transport protein A [Desulfuromonadaceae bacterium]|nr:ferrous iron transport protein A [Desulfuromonadaceae bacterium]